MSLNEGERVGFKESLILTGAIKCQQIYSFSARRAVKVIFIALDSHIIFHISHE